MARRTTVRLWREGEGETRFRITGSFPAWVRRDAIHQLFSLLTYWSGRPIHAVLFVGGLDGYGWVEEWSALLSEGPEALLRVHFRSEDDDAVAE